ncbi:hypothetical protein BEL07_17665 [Mycolicibacterium grossiae]|uniref:Uncharacterized protein n=1 Tax=Mycolicibacterium grossiae TaxID=1552759 RepID=A0A1E8Q2H1_9MYCO|nr:hypothetical protein [Mycolicibacterium grossiae]OFJ52451.1 hypothetical protein BEL07_17665 [Mycolicibacterium grossiae]
MTTGQFRRAIITAAPLDEDAASELARSLLSEGQSVDEVSARTGLSENHVEMLASSTVEPDVKRLAKYMNVRLAELGMSQLEASKLGLVSRSTLNLLGKDDRVPGRSTLSKLDELLSWVPGSAHATMYGSEPKTREASLGKRKGPVVDHDADDNYDNLRMWIEKRLLELQMSKSRLAAVGGPGRTTLATMGKRGYSPNAETLERIDTHLMWEPGSALAALKGGKPVSRRIDVTPHPATVPLHSLVDRLKLIKTRVDRQQETLNQQSRDIEQALAQARLVIEDLTPPQHRTSFPPS